MPKWQAIAAVEAATPLGWPIVWTVLCLCLLPAAWRRREEAAGSLALPLLASALVLEASFLVISIASDTRYHLWPMAASALAVILLSDQLNLRRWERFAVAGALALVAIGGIASRAMLPDAPDTYQGMIHAASG
jgi:EamA domain-containing membrane protein RarD